MSNRKEYMRQWQRENREHLKEYNRQRCKDNPEKMKEYRKQYHKDNQEEIKKYYQAHKEQHKQYLIDNKEYIKKRAKQYRIEHKDEIAKYTKQYGIDNKEHLKQCRIDNRKRRNQQARNKRKIDLKYNLNRRMSGAILKSLKGDKAGRRWESLVGYTLNDLIKRLKSTMPRGYDWNDYLRGKLHIDHKIPISVFNYTKTKHIDFKKCWALNNLQLLSAEENLMKHAKLDKPFQIALSI